MDILKNCNTKKLTKLIHEVIDGECGLTLPDYATYSGTWSHEQFSTICLLLKTKIYEILGNDQHSSTEEVIDKLIIDIVYLRIKDLRIAVSEHCPISGHSRLNFFDWNIKLSTCNNKLASTEILLMNLLLNATKNTPITMETNSIVTLNKNNSVDTVTNKTSTLDVVSTETDVVTTETKNVNIVTNSNNQLDMVTKEIISMELNIEELKYLLESLEMADKEIQELLQYSELKTINSFNKICVNK